MYDPILDLGICLVIASAAFLCLAGIGAVAKHFGIDRDIASALRSHLDGAEAE